MPRFRIGKEKRVATGFTVTKEILEAAKEKAGRIPLSSIIESLLEGWVKGEFTLEGAP